MPRVSRSRNQAKKPSVRKPEKTRFSEGEVVLCYEPDPAKKKVLYNSKVVKIEERFDENDDKFVQYLIHFHGWNSTWDRYVTEDFILKDTKENRELQKELAEKAKLTTGGTLFKKEYRRRRGIRSRTAARKSASTAASSEHTCSQTETVLGADERSDSSDDEMEPRANRYIIYADVPPRPNVRYSDTFKRLVGFDKYMIVAREKLLDLPREPNVINVLELFLHFYVTVGLKKYLSKNNKAKYDDLVGRVNVCKEIIDSLKICFDYYVQNVLLYDNEKHQFIQLQDETVSPPEENPLHKMFEDVIAQSESNIARALEAPSVLDSKVGSKRSLRSHHHHQNADESSSNLHDSKLDDSLNSNYDNGSNVTQQAPLRLAESILYDTHIKKLITKEIYPFSLVPKEYYYEVPTKPSLVYGAMHLARLFVKLPEILQFSPHTPEKIELILDYAYLFMDFLTSHREWFSESYYKDCEFDTY